MPARAPAPPAAPESRNEIVLVGRVAAPATCKELPSGDELTVFRVIVPRGPSARPVPAGMRPASVDTFDCVAWGAGAQRAARTWQKGDVVEVQGALRRRFWRAGGGPTSICEIEVTKVRRLSKAA